MSNSYVQLAKDTNPSPQFFAVSPSDTTSFSKPARALYIGSTGNVAVVGLDGVAVTFYSVPVGILPVQCIRVNSTNTTASGIVGLV